MAVAESDDQLSAFLKYGVYQFKSVNAVFIDPVRILNRSYTRFRISPSTYYSRFFPCSVDSSLENPKKRKRGKKEKNNAQNLNSREQIADQRHQGVRPALLRAHEALLGDSELLQVLRNLRNEREECSEESTSQKNELDFVQLGSIWQAPLYEIVLSVREDDTGDDYSGTESYDQRSVPIFDTFVANDGSVEMEAEFLGYKYILPKRSSFYMSDLRQIQNLIPDEADCGFNLILIDPPWENGSARQKLKYQTLPNRYFLSLPIKELMHTDGALVALWVTNREKLRNFVENELFPKWGVKLAATFYWLKVKADSSLISELDLFHHRPYECLLLGLSYRKEKSIEQLLRLKGIPDNRVFISVPGDYSRKPPIGELLLDYVPGIKPARCIELFSREMVAGWTSWGNEPLHFQDSNYFHGQDKWVNSK